MADILIRGMEMPRDCPMCKLAHFNKLDEFTGCDAVPGKRYVPHSDGQFWNSSKRPSWCPLLPLPAGHGRLGDLDKLEDDFIRYYLSQERSNHLVFTPVEIKQHFADMIADFSTIVPAEGGGKDGV